MHVFDHFVHPLIHTIAGAENKPEKAEETDKETKEVIEDKEKTPSTDPRKYLIITYCFTNY